MLAISLLAQGESFKPMQFTQYWSVWLLTLVPWQRILGNPHRVLSQDVLIGLICDSLLKASQHSLVFSRKIRNPIICYILIRQLWTPWKPQPWGCFPGVAWEPPALRLASYCLSWSDFLCCFILGGGEGVKRVFYHLFMRSVHWKCLSWPKTWENKLENVVETTSQKILQNTLIFAF